MAPIASARPLTAEDAIVLALEHSHSVAAAEEGVTKANADERKALMAMSPKVSAMGMYRYQTPLPEITWDVSSLYGTDGSSSTSCADIPWASLGLPDDLTQEQYTAVCEWYTLVQSYSTPAPTTMVVGVHHNYTVQFAVDQVLYAGQALRHAHQASKEMLRSSEAQLRQARIEAANAAVQAFYGLYLAREAAQVFVDAKTTVDGYVTDLQNLVTVGMGLESDLLAAKAQQSRTRLDAMRAERGAAVADLIFRATLGLPPDEPLELTLGDAPNPTLPLNQAALIELAVKQRPELEALNASVGALAHYASASWTTWKPVLALNFTYLGQRPDPYSAMFGSADVSDWFFSSSISLVASWTLWDQGAALYGHRAAVAGRRQLEEQERLVLDMLPVEIASALSSYQEALQSQEVARVGLLQAQESLRLEQNRFQQGMSNNTQILLAHSALSSARLSVLQAETSLRTSYAALCKAIGMDPEKQR